MPLFARSKIQHLASAQDGVALVEFAVIVPMIALLLIGLIEVGRFTAFSIRLSNAAHAGATYGIARPDGQNAQDASNIAAAACTDSGFSCTAATPAPGHTASPDTMYIASSMSCTYSNGTTNTTCAAPSAGVTRNILVQVATSGTFKPLFSYPYMPNAVPMSASATMQAGQ